MNPIALKILNSLSKTDVWKWFVENYLDITLRTSGYPLFPIEDFFRIIDLAAADRDAVYCFGSSDYKTLGSLAVRKISNSQLSHAGFLMPDTYKTSAVFHIRTSGIHLEHLLSLLKEIDYLIVVRVALDSQRAKEAHRRMNDIITNKEKYHYDFSESLDNGQYQLYCSEMITSVLKDLIPMTPRVVLGKTVFLPDQVTELGKVIYSNHPQVKMAA